MSASHEMANRGVTPAQSLSIITCPSLPTQHVLFGLLRIKQYGVWCISVHQNHTGQPLKTISIKRRKTMGRPFVRRAIRCYSADPSSQHILAEDLRNFASIVWSANWPLLERCSCSARSAKAQTQIRRCGLRKVM